MKATGQFRILAEEEVLKVIRDWVVTITNFM